jgi:hypothetical protein
LLFWFVPAEKQEQERGRAEGQVVASQVNAEKSFGAKLGHPAHGIGAKQRHPAELK